MLNRNNIDSFAKAITHYVFRNGPVEDMHSAGKLSQEDMRTLNKYMVDRMAGLLSMMMHGQWAGLLMAYEQYYRFLGKEWDPANPDVEEFEFLRGNSNFEEE